MTSNRTQCSNEMEKEPLANLLPFGIPADAPKGTMVQELCSDRFRVQHSFTLLLPPRDYNTLYPAGLIVAPSLLPPPGRPQAGVEMRKAAKFPLPR